MCGNVLIGYCTRSVPFACSAKLQLYGRFEARIRGSSNVNFRPFTVGSEAGTALGYGNGRRRAGRVGTKLQLCAVRVIDANTSVSPRVTSATASGTAGVGYRFLVR